MSNSSWRCPWNFSDKITGMGCYFLLQGIFPIQGSNPHLCLLHSRRILYLLSHQDVKCQHVKLLHLCLTLGDSMDCSPPGSSVHGILQARILECVAIPFFRKSSPPKDGTCVSYVFVGRQVLLPPVPPGTIFHCLGFLCPHSPWVVPDSLRLYQALRYNSSETADLSNWISYAVCLRNAIIPRSTFNLNLEKFHPLSWVEAPILYIACFPFSWFTLSSGWSNFSRGFVRKTVKEIAHLENIYSLPSYLTGSFIGMVLIDSK